VWELDRASAHACDPFTSYDGDADIPDPWSGQGNHRCYFDVEQTLDVSSMSSFELAVRSEINSAKSDESWGFNQFSITFNDGGAHGPVVECVGFSRTKSAADSAASSCLFKGQTPEADRTNNDGTYHTFYRSYPEPMAPDLETAVIDLGEALEIQAFRIFNQNEYRSGNPAYGRSTQPLANWTVEGTI
jgi:hypothetical protein